MPRDITVEGKVVDVSDGEYRINKGYTHGYLSMRVKVDHKFYTASFSTNKFNKFGFIPKTGHWVRLTGKLFPGKDGYDPSIKWITKLEHIEEPTMTLADRLMAQMKKM